MNMRTYIRLLSLALLAFVAYTPATYAGTATTSFTVTATVDPSCVVTANNLAFGLYNPTNGTTAMTTLNVTCTNGGANTPTFTVALGPGQHPISGGGRRMLHNSSDYLRYDLYTTNAYSTRWGDGTNGTVVRTGAGTGAHPFDVFGKVNSGQVSAPDGNYDDVISVTVTYQ